MARRRKNESIFVMMMDAPWWLGVAAAAAFYFGVGKIAPAMMDHGVTGGVIANPTISNEVVVHICLIFKSLCNFTELCLSVLALKMMLTIIISSFLG
jgi:hypothetical protein